MTSLPPRKYSVHDALWERQTIRFLDGRPHGWMQMKNTDVCMDVRCSCGASTHIDGMFAYAVKCPKCGQAYFVNGHVELVPMTPDEVGHWELDGASFLEGRPH